MDEDDLIRRSFGEPNPDSAAEARARAALMARIRGETQHSYRRRRLRIGSFAAIAAVVAAIVVVASLSAGPAPPAAARELDRLADITRTTYAPRLGAGEFLLMRAEELRPQSFTVLGGPAVTFSSRLTVETWVAQDGSGYRRTTVIDVVYPSEQERRRIEALNIAELPQPGEVRTEHYAAGNAPWFDTSGLSSDPSTLLSQLRSGEPVQHPPGDVEVFAVVGDLLAQGDASAEVRAAMLGAAGRLDGVTYLGEVPDPLGRPGVGFSMEGSGQLVTLTFDSATAHLLSAQTDDGVTAWRAFEPAVVTRERP